MRRTIIAAGVLMLLAWPAWAERQSFEGQGCVTTNTTTEKVLHGQQGVGFDGDEHYDIEFDSTDNSEAVFCHGIFPINTIPNFKAKYNIETEESTVGKQICIEVNACADRTGTQQFDCTGNQDADAKLVFTLPTSGAFFVRNFITALSTQGTIHSGSGGALCPFPGTDCVDASVRYKVFQNNSIPGCTNPIAAGVKWRMRWMTTYTQ